LFLSDPVGETSRLPVTGPPPGAGFGGGGFGPGVGGLFPGGCPSCPEDGGDTGGGVTTGGGVGGTGGFVGGTTGGFGLS